MSISEHIRSRLTDPKVLSILGAGAIATMVGLIAILVDSKAQQPYLTDFVLFYTSGLQLFHGADVYATLPVDVLAPIPDGVEAPDRAMRANLNPPLAVLLMSPLSRLTYEHAFWTWWIISLGCAFASAWLLAGGFATGERRIRWSIGILVLLLAYTPTWIAFYIGQMTFLVFLLLVAGWRATREGNERSAALILGTTLAIKPFVGMLLFFFAAHRRWRLLAWYAGGFAAANLVAAAIMGPHTFVRYLETLKGVNWHAVDLNASLFGFLTRLSGSSGGQPLVEGYEWLHVLGYAIAAFLAGSLVLMVVRLPDWPSRRGIDIGYAYSIVLMLLISPLGWVYYFPMLFLCILVVFLQSRTLPSRRHFRAASGATWLLGAVMYFLFIAQVLPRKEDALFKLPDAYLMVLVLTAAILFMLAVATGPRTRGQ